MESAQAQNSIPDPVAAALAEILARLEAKEDFDVEGAIAAHGDLAEAIRQAYALWLEVAGAMGHTDRAMLSETISQGRRRSRDLLERIGDLDAADRSRYGAIWDSVFRRLAEHAPHHSRYVVQRDIDAGGMGSIHQVWDQDLRRKLAMKRIREEVRATPAKYQEALRRFLDEAQFTAQLDHPGVVPVHDLGMDAEGRPYFTMKLVKGATLTTVFGKARAGEDGWTVPRALAVLQRVCETMAFAHSRRVLHRDLKPANIMVGRFGETHVMDWGLARLHEEGVERPPTPDGQDLQSGSVVLPERAFLDGKAPDSVLYSAHEALGTPPYMPPEAALRQRHLIGFHSDVYSMGAILYELLVGRAPYVDPERKKDGIEIWEEVKVGAPTPVDRLVPDANPELVAICEKAMARDVADRYRSMEELGDEIRSFLEGRVVAAYRTGAAAELSKWVSRNRAAAGALAAAVLAVVLGAVLFAWSEAGRTAEAAKSTAGRVAAQLVAEAEEGLGPIHPDLVDTRQRWLEAAGEALAAGVGIRSDLAALRARAEPVGEEALAEFRRTHPRAFDVVYLDELLGKWDPTPEQLEVALADPKRPAAKRREAGHLLEIYRWHEERRRRFQEEIDTSQPWTFTRDEDQRVHDGLRRAVRNLDRLAGLVGMVERELEQARRLHAETVVEWQSKWEAAIEAIRVEPRYGGLELSPQIGLVPLGPDPESGLWEFLVELSGEPPVRDQNGRFLVEPHTGIVLVLLPAVDDLVLGADPKKGPHVDPAASAIEEVWHVDHLDAFFLAKYELTQGQWLRVVEQNPSKFTAGDEYDGLGRVLWNHPAESFSWERGQRVLDLYGLGFPTEAQHEYAMRGGATTPYWWQNVEGFDESQIVYVRSDEEGPRRVDHGPPNGFGLHNIAGNVAELCQDWFTTALSNSRISPGTGELVVVERRRKTVRGGMWNLPRSACRSTWRSPIPASAQVDVVGARPSRLVDT